jgi:hypothetical protein
MTPKDGWHIVDVTKENVKEEELLSRVNNVKDVQMTKSKLEQHKQRQVKQLMTALNSRETDGRFQWFPSTITHEGKRLAVIVERGPKVGFNASEVYKAVMATPISFAPGPPQASSEFSRLGGSGVCSDNTERKSGCHIIMLAYKNALEWVQTSNGQASG